MVTRPEVNLDELMIETPEQFRVHGSVYSDEKIFELEMERIFHSGWVYVGHESEIPRGGDYKSTFVGTQPVILTRHADDNRIYVLYNRCRHKGTTVCQEEYGNSNYFRCSYHGWVYSNKGDLVGVTGPELYGKGFNQAELGLVPVACVDDYRGFIFARLVPEGPTLLEHLGNATKKIDQFIEQWPQGKLTVDAGVQKYGYNGNWKLQLENTVDSYHFPIVHATMLEIAKRRSNGMISYDRVEAAKRRVWDLGNGHASFEAGLGEVHFIVFPNLALLGLQVRVIYPITPTRTEVQLHMTMLEGAPDEVNEKRLRLHEEGFGPSGFIGPDDQEVAFTRIPIGLRATKGNDWVIMERGIEFDESHEDGSISTPARGEVTWRGIFRQWKKLLS